MNQRIKRFKDRKRQNIEGIVVNTGGHLAQHTSGKDPIVRTPQKTTGEVPVEKQGFAKASPNFKKLKEVLPVSKEDEKKAIAEALEKTNKEKEKEKDKQ